MNRERLPLDHNDKVVHLYLFFVMFLLTDKFIFEMKKLTTTVTTCNAFHEFPMLFPKNFFWRSRGIRFAIFF